MTIALRSFSACDADLLAAIEESLEKSVKECLKDMNDILAENIFEQYENLVELAVAEANHTVSNCTVR